jgi:hypothetical protein
MATASSDPVMSRNAGFGIGKVTETCKTLVTYELKEDFARKAREAGYAGESECLRDLIALWTYGVEHVESMHRRRMQALSAIVQETER